MGTYDLEFEPNPFEQSFASKSPQNNSNNPTPDSDRNANGTMSLNDRSRSITDNINNTSLATLNSASAMIPAGSSVSRSYAGSTKNSHSANNNNSNSNPAGVNNTQSLSTHNIHKLNGGNSSNFQKDISTPSSSNTLTTLVPASNINIKATNDGNSQKDSVVKMGRANIGSMVLPLHGTNMKPPVILSPSILSPGGSRHLPMPTGHNSNNVSGVNNSSSLGGNGSLTPSTFFLNFANNASNITSSSQNNIQSGQNNNNSNNNNNNNKNMLENSIRTGLTPAILYPQSSSSLSGASASQIVGNSGNAVMNRQSPGSSFLPSTPNSRIQSILGLPTSSFSPGLPLLNNVHLNMNMNMNMNTPGLMNSVMNQANASLANLTSNPLNHSHTDDIKSNNNNFNKKSNKVVKKETKKRKGKKTTDLELSASMNSYKTGGKAMSKQELERATANIDDDEKLTEEEKAQRRKEFLERNRVAASKFRKRKKEYVSKIERKLSFYKKEYKELTNDCIGLVMGFPSTSSNNGNTNLNLIECLRNSISNKNFDMALSFIDQLGTIVSKTSYVQRGGVDMMEEEERNEQNDEDDD